MATISGREEETGVGVEPQALDPAAWFRLQTPLSRLPQARSRRYTPLRLNLSVRFPVLFETPVVSLPSIPAERLRRVPQAAPSVARLEAERRRQPGLSPTGFERRLKKLPLRMSGMVILLGAFVTWGSIFALTGGIKSQTRGNNPGTSAQR